MYGWQAFRCFPGNQLRLDVALQRYGAIYSDDLAVTPQRYLCVHGCALSLVDIPGAWGRRRSVPLSPSPCCCRRPRIRTTNALS